MAKTDRFLLLPAIALAALLALQVVFGCHGRGAEPLVVDDYRIDGAFVLDCNLDSTYVVAALQRNDTTLATGTIRFGGLPLGFFSDAMALDSIYMLRLDSATIFAGAQEYLYLADGTRYRDSILFAVPDTFSITDNFLPANHLLNGPGQVAFEWTVSPNAEGYVVATVKADSAYSGAGYSAYAISGVTGGTIPTEAFVDPISQEADTGLYNVYVYAFVGSPDSVISSRLLPVPFPEQRADNVHMGNAVGRFGTISVVCFDTVRVAALSAR